MFGFFVSVKNAFKLEVRNLLRNEFEWTTDLFVRFDPHADHLIKVGIKSKVNEYAVALALEFTSVAIRATEIKNDSSPERLEIKQEYLDYLKNDLGNLVDSSEERIGRKGVRFVLQLAADVSNS